MGNFQGFGKAVLGLRLFVTFQKAKELPVFLLKVQCLFHLGEAFGPLHGCFFGFQGFIWPEWQSRAVFGIRHTFKLAPFPPGCGPQPLFEHLARRYFQKGQQGGVSVGAGLK